MLFIPIALIVTEILVNCNVTWSLICIDLRVFHLWLVVCKIPSVWLATAKEKDVLWRIRGESQFVVAVIKLNDWSRMHENSVWFQYNWNKKQSIELSLKSLVQCRLTLTFPLCIILDSIIMQLRLWYVAFCTSCFLVSQSWFYLVKCSQISSGHVNFLLSSLFSFCFMIFIFLSSITWDYKRADLNINCSNKGDGMLDVQD